MMYCNGCGVTHTEPMCVDWSVQWTFGGTTTVTAPTAQQAREAFRAMVSDDELLDTFEPDIVSVEESAE